jgi:hypothetical protein
MPGNVPPATDIKRWTPVQKATVLDAVRFGNLTLEDACDRYRLTLEELASWQATMDHQGIAGLRIRRQAERRSERRATLENVALALVNGTVPVACKIANIGARVAQLEFRGPVSLPTTFELRIGRSGRSSRVRVIWQRDRFVGVRTQSPVRGAWNAKTLQP